jgi:hypothetical protein
MSSGSLVRCSLLSIPALAPAQHEEEHAEEEPIPAAAIRVVVQPTLHCRRCDREPEFASAADLRAHFKLLHATSAAAEDDRTSSSSSESPDPSSECDDGSSGETASHAGPLFCVRFRECPARELWVYRVLLSSASPALAAAVASRTARSPTMIVDYAEVLRPGETWAVFAFASGYFMSTVWQIAPSVGQENSRQFPRCILHKRHHRYTTRRKQGGSQSAHDAKGRPAKSVGAQMRREGERQLFDDVRSVFTSAEWAPAIRACRRIVLAVSRRERPAFLLAAAPALSKDDPRIFAPPFETGRPSLDTATTIVRTLLSVATRSREGDARIVSGKAGNTVMSSAGLSHGVSEGVAASGGSATSAVGAVALPVPAGGSSSPPFRNDYRVSSVVGDSCKPGDVSLGDESCAAEADGMEDAHSDDVHDATVTLQRPKLVSRKSKPKKKKKPAARAAPGEDNAVCSPHRNDEDDALHAAMLAADEEALQLQAQEQASALVAAARASATTAVEEAAARLRIPHTALVAAVGLPRSMEFESSAATSAGAVGSRVLELHAIADQMATVVGLLDAGATAAQALSAVGLDGLAAAAIVASSVFVDWQALTAIPPLRSAPAASSARPVEELSAAVGAGGARRVQGKKR